MSYTDKIRQFVVTEILADVRAAGLADDDPLISSGRVDSLGLVQILMHIQQQFGVDLMTVGSPEDFDSIKALAAAVERHKSGQ